MSYQFLTITREGPVATVAMNRPESRNALNMDIIAELHRVALDLRDDREISAIVLTGTDTCFSAGADRKDDRIFAPVNRTLLDHWRDTEGGSETARAWEALPQITIAAIEGFAVGGGFTLAMACDLRVMGESAFIQIPEVPLGFNYGWNSIPRMVDLIGPARTKRVVVFGERITAEQSENWGLADYLAPDGQAAAKAQELARNSAALPQMAVQFTKRAVNAVVGRSQDISSHADMAQIVLCLEAAKGTQGA
ncbi:MAG: enoyl-CoA hydratase/isomerase family protein [Paracoccaceae bacterium]